MQVEREPRHLGVVPAPEPLGQGLADAAKRSDVVGPDEDLVQINTERMPFDDLDGIYMDCIGRPYYVAPRMWWSEFSRTTLLTTELVLRESTGMVAGATAGEGIKRHKSKIG